MDRKEIERRFSSAWNDGYGSVSIDEIQYIQNLIQTHKPRTFIEIGMASGLSTGFIANFLSENGGESLLSIDYDEKFYGDRSKPSGFLVPQLYTGNDVAVELLRSKTSLDLTSMADTFEMAFIDANHQHPWPLIDMLFLWPHLVGPKIVIHHDLTLYHRQNRTIGIGPKYLFDQFPDKLRDVSTGPGGGNIFSLNLDIEKSYLEQIARDAFKLPWSLWTSLTRDQIRAIEDFLGSAYSAELANHFRDTSKYFNVSRKPRSTGQGNVESLHENSSKTQTLWDRIRSTLPR